MDELPLREYFASCHCGALAARYRTALPVAAWSVRACRCSFCRAHEALATSDPDGRLEFRAARPERLKRYRFGSMLTDFLLCSECGVYLGAQLTSAPFGILNARALVPIPSNLPPAQPMDFAAESASEKTTRRQARWTPLMA
jgi:hypothetical protein